MFYMKEPTWFNGNLASSNIVMLSSVNIIRNIANSSFPKFASENEKKDISEVILSSLDSQSFYNYKK